MVRRRRKNSVDPHSAGRDFAAVGHDRRSRAKVRRAKRRARTWHSIPLSPRSGSSTRSIDDSESEGRETGSTSAPLYLFSVLEGPRVLVRCCPSSSSTPRLAERSDRRDRSLDFHTSLRPLCSPLLLLN